MPSKFWVEYERQIRAGLRIDQGHDPIAHLALGLAGEAGEVADIIKKSQYKDHSLSSAELYEELGDVLWYLMNMATRFGWSLENLALGNVEKLELRRHGEYNGNKLAGLFER